MSRREKLVALFFVWVLTPTAVLMAQNDGGNVKVEILALADSGVIRDLHYLSSEGENTLTVYSRGFGPAIEYKGPAQLVFFRPVASGEGFEELERNIVGRAVLPAGATRVLLLFNRNEDEDRESYRIRVLNNNLSEFPPGAYRIFNLTENRLAVVMGDERMNLESERMTVAAPDGDENGNFEVRFYAYKDSELKRIYSSVWAVKETRRSSVFLMPSSSRVEEIDVKKIVEPLLPPSSETE